MAEVDQNTVEMLEFTLPSLGADMDRGTVVRWHVDVGDRVAKGDVLLDVDTEKSEIEVEVWYDATVAELIARPGDSVDVGGLLARLERADSDGPLRSPAVDAEPPVSVDPITASPPVATSSGLGSDDDRGGVPGPRTVYWTLPAAAGSTAATSGDDHGIPGSEVPKKERRSRVRGAIGDLMSRANSEIPHYHLSREVDMDAAVAWLERSNAAKPVTERVLSAAMVIRAVAVAAERVPELNGHWLDGAFAPAPSIDIGVAVHLRGGGLMVPVIADVGNLSLDEVMSQLRGVVNRARSGRVKSSDLTEGSLTVTNTGDAGADQVLGVIHPPQVALVGIGRIHQVARVVDGSVEARNAVTISLAADHRATDGHVGSRFLESIDHALQRPEDL